MISVFISFWTNRSNLDLYFHWVSTYIQLTKMGHSDLLITVWIISEFEKVDLQKCSNYSCSILGSVYLKSTVNLQKCSDHSCSILGSVYLKYTLTCKNALIIPVVSRVVYTWNLQLICKNALIIPVVSWVVYTWNIR